ncbi:MAG: hypothetical protein ABSD98_12875 [Candidatus Korobacteraceae bacterium]|jgi:hypothetical protein
MAPSYNCSSVVEIDQEPRHHLVIANEFVRAFAVEIAPHDRTLCHRHPHDYLLYVASDAEIISAARDEEQKKLSYRDGECELSLAGLVHVVENLGDAPFRNVVVELLPAASSLRRNDDPKLMQGDGRVTQQFDDERAAILVAKMSRGAGMKICGPAVIASCYGHQLSLALSRREEHEINSLNDLCWLGAGELGIATNLEAGDAKVVIIQIGTRR